MSVPFKFNGTMLVPLILEAEKRNAFKQGSRARSRKVSKEHSEFESIYIGLIGEYAVAMTFGILPSAENHRGGDGGVDLKLLDGRSIQVKTTCTTDYLIFNKDARDLTSELAVLVKLRTPCSGEIVGWITAEGYREKRTSRDFQYGSRWVVHADALNPMETFTVHADEYRDDSEDLTNP